MHFIRENEIKRREAKLRPKTDLTDAAGKVSLRYSFLTLGLASVVHSMVTWVLTGAPISWFGMYIIGWTEQQC